MSSSTPTSAATNAATNADRSQASGGARRSQLKVFLGYAAGVGKTYRMLEEVQGLKRQGKDIVVGYFEPHGRKDTIAKASGLELIPRRSISYRGSTFQEMDTAAILSRRPAICAVDELAHTNVPGSEHSKRWEDVQVLLDAGIDVMTNMNIQHLESLNDQVFLITGIRVRETVPDWFVKGADEVVMVDATTGALLNRLKRGDIYATEKAQRAMENFFKESTLTALRELALRQAAHQLDLREVASTSQELESRKGPSAGSPPQEKAIQDRILIYVSADASTAMLIRRGRRMADYLGADCFAISVMPSQGEARLPNQEREAVEKHLTFAGNLHIETQVLQGDDPAEVLVDFAHSNQITQILLSRRDCGWWGRLLGTDLILRIVQMAKDIRVIIVAERRKTA
jgi:two-component system, OmpR family, sensor histidine kinase KdpD